MIKEYAYSKINLSLNVLDKRKDGFHELRSIMAPLSLYDELTFTEASSLVFESNRLFADEICLKVARIIINKYNITKGVKITCIKNIPSEAGLGGGSACAAATIRGLNRFYNLNMSISEQDEICAMVGSDVTFCLHSRLAFASGRGEKIKLIDIDYKNVDIILVKPDFGNSTKEVYKVYKNLNNINNKDEMIIKALKDNDIKLLKENIYNDLLTAACTVSAKQKEVYDELNLLADFYLSGSGSTCFTFDYSNNLFNILKEKYKDYKIIKAQLINNKG